MKEPRRLLSHGATDFERQLLRAVVSERPSAVLRSRMQRGLGLMGPLAWASSVKAMVATAAGKLLGGSVLSGLIAVAGVAVLSSAPSESRPRAATNVSFERVAAEQPAPLVAAPPVAPEAPAPPAAEPAPVPVLAEPAPAEAAPALAAAEPADDDDSRLREEIALLDAARGSLQRGDRAAAAASLRTYRERFPSGILRREANVLRRRAEQKRGRASQSGR
jgi:hypothetical protein